MEDTVRPDPQAWISRLSSRQTASEESRGDEAGSSLVLALVFLVAVSLIVMGLLGWLGTSLNASAVFSSERNIDNAATNAVNLAIQNTRYTFDLAAPNSMLDAASPQSCLSPAYPVDNGSGSVAVYCTMVWQPNGATNGVDAYSNNQSQYSRVVTYSACYSGDSSSATPTTCAAQPRLQAVVGFDDYPAGSVAPSIDPTECAPITSNGTCGETMTQLSWQWNPVVPAVTSISPSSGPITGGTTIQINGTGFVSGETVNFLEESGGGPTSGYNPPVTATLVSSPPATCALPTCLEAVTPTVVSGSTYFVTVTTPGGTSPYSPASPYSPPVFTYQAGTPVVTGLTGSVTGGPVTGGSTVTIQGTGFWGSSTVPAQVFFCPTTGGSCSASPSNTSAGVTVTPPSGSTPAEITAQSPAVGPTGVGTYDVQVEVNNVYSALTSSAQFTYALFVPVVTSVTPQTPVAPGGSITINGYNFVTGIYIGYCQQTGTSPYYSSSCTGAGGNAGGSPTLVPTQDIVSTNQIVVPVPSGLGAGVYYPIVAYGTAPWSSPDPGSPGNPYAEAGDEFTVS
jgi:hypothetical protein